MHARVSKYKKRHLNALLGEFHYQKEASTQSNIGRCHKRVGNLVTDCCVGGFARQSFILETGTVIRVWCLEF